MTKEAPLNQFQILVKAARTNILDDSAWNALYDWLEENNKDVEPWKWIRRDCLLTRLESIRTEKVGRRIAYQVECQVIGITPDQEDENYGKYPTEEEKEINQLLQRPK